MRTIKLPIKKLSGLLLTISLSFLCGCAVEDTADISSEMAYLSAGRDAINKEAETDIIIPEIEGELTLEKAIEVATKYNQDKFAVDFMAALQAESKERGLLEDISNYTQLENVATDDSKLSENVAFTCSVLDFGVSYMKNRIENSEGLCTPESIRRVKQNISLEVSEAYWQAIAANAVVLKAKHIEKEIEAKIKSIEVRSKNNEISNAEGLKEKLPLLKRKEYLVRISNTADVAKANLARVMGLQKKDVNFNLPDTEMIINAIDFDKAHLESLALMNRPEVSGLITGSEVVLKDTWIEIVKAFPAFAAAFKKNATDNESCLSNQWSAAGLSVAWQLLSIPQNWQKLQDSMKPEELISYKRTALAAGILSQVNLAVLGYEKSMMQYEYESAVRAGVNRDIGKIKDECYAGKVSFANYIDQQLDSLEGYRQYVNAEEKVMSSLARVLNAVGLKGENTYLAFGTSCDGEDSVAILRSAGMQAMSSCAKKYNSNTISPKSEPVCTDEQVLDIDKLLAEVGGEIAASEIDGSKEIMDEFIFMMDGEDDIVLKGEKKKVAPKKEFTGGNKIHSIKDGTSGSFEFIGKNEIETRESSVVKTTLNSVLTKGLPVAANEDDLQKGVVTEGEEWGLEELLADEIDRS